MNRLYHQYRRKIFACTLVGLLLFVGFPGFRGALFTQSADAGFFSDDLESFEEIVGLIAEKYVYPPDYRKMFEAAVSGMIKETDPNKKLVKKFNEDAIVFKDDTRLPYQLTYSRPQNMRTFRRIYYTLHKKSKGSLDKTRLEVAGINGVMDALDAYSQYLDPSAFDKSIQDTEGKYGGLGMVITMKDYELVIVKTMRNSPARRAGLLEGDIISHINGQVVKGMQIQELTDLLRGYPNTKVQLTFKRPKTKKVWTQVLVRQIIAVETVELKMLEHRTAYIKITNFSKTTENQLRAAIQRAKRDSLKGIVLDLRDNPGGLLDQSVNVASHFLYENQLIVYTLGRKNRDRDDFHSRFQQTLAGVPLVILINNYSASAAEIVAGSLKDSGGALLIGERSFGKGSVQTIFRVSDGAGLRLTTAKYYTPSGIDITKNGIAPDIHVVKDAFAEGENVVDPDAIKKRALKNSPITLKQSDLERYLESSGNAQASDDPLIQFAHLLLKDVRKKNKWRTLERAREIASSIRY